MKGSDRRRKANLGCKVEWMDSWLYIWEGGRSRRYSLPLQVTTERYRDVAMRI